jgi:hypothetical protein
VYGADGDVAVKCKRLFRDISGNRLRRGMCTGVPELACEPGAVHHNPHPKPAIWTAPARDMLRELLRAKCR